MNYATWTSKIAAYNQDILQHDKMQSESLQQVYSINLQYGCSIWCMVINYAAILLQFWSTWVRYNCSMNAVELQL